MLQSAELCFFLLYVDAFASNVRDNNHSVHLHLQIVIIDGVTWYWPSVSSLRGAGLDWRPQHCCSVSQWPISFQPDTTSPSSTSRQHCSVRQDISDMWSPGQWWECLVTWQPELASLSCWAQNIVKLVHWQTQPVISTHLEIIRLNQHSPVPRQLTTTISIPGINQLSSFYKCRHNYKDNGNDPSWIIVCLDKLNKVLFRMTRRAMNVEIVIIIISW